MSFYKENIIKTALRRAKGNTHSEIFISLINEFINEDWIGVGGNRAVFKRNNYVVKVPIGWDGIYDNNSEYFQYKELKKTGYIPFAACRMAGKHLLIMEYVRPVTLDKYPEWVKSVDCRQVGLDRKGKLVAYDYSANWS